MYKSKLTFWSVVLLISILINIFKDGFSFASFVAKEYPMYCAEDEYFAIKFDNFSKSEAKISLTNNINSARIIIQYSSDEAIEGFTKYPEQFSSDLVIYAQCDAYRGDSYFIRNIRNDISKYKTFKSMKLILEAIENGKTYDELNLPNDSFGSGQIVLVIPGEALPYRDKCLELMAYALNGYSYDGIDSEDVTKRLNAILEKCETYESEQSLMYSIFREEEADSRKLYLAPYYINVNSSVSRYSNGYYCVDFFLEKTMSVTYDMYLKEVTNVHWYQELLKALTKKKFYNTTGLVNKDIDFKYDVIYPSDHQ